MGLIVRATETLSPRDSAWALSAYLFWFHFCFFFFLFVSFSFCFDLFYPFFCLIFRAYARKHREYVPGIISLQVIRDGHTTPRYSTAPLHDRIILFFCHRDAFLQPVSAVTGIDFRKIRHVAWEHHDHHQQCTVQKHSSLSPKRDCSPKRVKYRFSSAVYTHVSYSYPK